MTIQEFHQAFNLRSDKTQDYEYPYLSPEQIDFWLNEAQDEFVKSRAFGNNLRRDGFEETQKRVDDLKTIVKKSSITPTKSTNTYINILPNDYLYLVRHSCTVVSANCGTQVVGGNQVTHDEINEVVIDPFWKPDFDEPIYYFENGSLVQEGASDYNITNTSITYIKQYNKLRYGTSYINPTTDVQCELPIHTHSEIVKLATSMFLENIESPRYQSNLNELTKTE